jgi:hypothetical protein
MVSYQTASASIGGFTSFEGSEFRTGERMNNNQAASLAAAAIGIACVVIILLLVVGIFFLLTLQKALTRCSKRNRTMEPGMVWLNLIPLFNYVWNFVTVIRVGDSLKNEFSDRDIDQGGDYGKTLGITMSALGIGSGILSNVGNTARAPAVSMIAGLIGLASLVMFIVYWVQIAGYSQKLGEDDQRGDDEDEDDVDDEPRRPSRRARPDDRIR